MTARTVGRPRKRGMVGGRERVRVGICCVYLYLPFKYIDRDLITIYITCVQVHIISNIHVPGTCTLKQNYFFSLIFLLLIRGHMVEVILDECISKFSNESWESTTR